MKIVILAEGQTEKVFLPFLSKYLSNYLPGSMPALRAAIYDGRIPKGDDLRRTVHRLLNCGKNSADHVIALTDVYTGSNDFVDAVDAIEKMRTWVGNEPRFHPHAAQYDFEAWLLPYWTTIQRLADHTRAAPAGPPETVNHQRSPATYISEIFRTGKNKRAYIKTRDAYRILRDNNLHDAVIACPQLKALVNTILKISGGELIS